MPENSDRPPRLHSPISRRQVLAGAGGTGLLAAATVSPAKAATRARRSRVFSREAADAVEDAVWSARRDTATGYGIAVFDVDPGHGSDDQPSIKVTHYHAVGADPVNPGTGAKGAPTPDYTEFETFTLVRPR